MKLSRKIVAAAFVMSALTALRAAPPTAADTRAEAVRYLHLDDKTAREYAQNLDPTTAAALLSQVRAEARTRNPDVDRLSYLIAHLESQHAIALAQKRLNNLLLVIGLTVGLFAAFLSYLLISQKKSFSRIALLMARPPAPDTRPAAVYRGE